MTRDEIVKEKYSAVFNSAVADKNRRNKNPAEITRYTVIYANFIKSISFCRIAVFVSQATVYTFCTRRTWCLYTFQILRVKVNPLTLAISLWAVIRKDERVDGPMAP